MKDIIPILQEYGITVKDAAKYLEIKPTALEKKLKNEHLMRLDEARILAELLNFTVDGLFLDPLYNKNDVKLVRIIRKIQDMNSAQIDLVWFFVKGLTDKKEGAAE